MNHFNFNRANINTQSRKHRIKKTKKNNQESEINTIIQESEINLINPIIQESEIQLFKMFWPNAQLYILFD